jgi:hypothetical protein
LTIIMPQEPSSRESLAFALVRHMTAVITDPPKEVGSGGGRDLTPSEEETYDNALAVLNDVFKTKLQWVSTPTGIGLYVLTHITKALIEAVVVVPNGQYVELHGENTRLPVSEATGFWLGPLPMAPTIKNFLN